MFHSIYNHSFNPPVIDDFLNSNLHFKKVSLNGRQVSNLQYLCRLFLETREQLYAAHEKTETEAIDSIPRAFWIQNAGVFLIKYDIWGFNWFNKSRKNRDLTDLTIWAHVM
jgi:hypothetical protein